MRIYHIVSFCLLVFLSACQQTNGIDNIKTNQNAKTTENSEVKKIELPTENKEIFYLTEKDIIEMPKYLAQMRNGMDLIIYHNCLSLKSRNSENKIYTFVLNDDSKVLFDENQKIIGIINTTSNKKILLGDIVGLNGLTSEPATLSKKPVPKECSQTLLFTGEVF